MDEVTYTNDDTGPLDPQKLQEFFDELRMAPTGYVNKDGSSIAAAIVFALLVILRLIAGS